MKVKKIKLPIKIKRPVLALGSHAKNTVCFAQGDFAYISPVQQNLNEPKDLAQFEKNVNYFLKKHPKIIAYDMHPEYQSTKFTQNLQPTTYNLQPIQHHHAHIASCMADNGLINQKVIGVAFDGTGLGSDNSLWGAEFLLCDFQNFKRAAHLKEIPLLGGEKAVSEPWRVSALWLYLAFKDEFLNLRINFTKGLKKNEWRVLKNMYQSRFNSPSSSSMGRLFDAAASLILTKYKVEFEAELAMELEKLAGPPSILAEAISYQFKITKNKNTFVIDPMQMFKGIIADLKTKEKKEKIAYRFHLTIAEMINKTCLLLRKTTKINKAVLCGGVFQNNLLLNQALDLLYKEDFKVFVHKNVSCNDSGISLGQAVIAGAKVRCV